MRQFRLTLLNLVVSTEQPTSPNPTLTIMKHSSERKRGFTLIELLVVITIIGILATVAIGPMGDLIFGAGKDAAGTSLAEVFKSGRNNKGIDKFKWPGKDTLGSAQEFAVHQLDNWKTDIDDAGVWFLPNDPAREAMEDEDIEIPTKILAKKGSLDKFKVAFGYNIAVPPTFSQALKKADSGPYPIMWTRGLDKGDTEWSEDSPWEGQGGHVLFSNGKVEWLEKTQTDDRPEGVFKKFRKRGDQAEDSYTSDIGDAIPDNWEVLKPDA